MRFNAKNTTNIFPLYVALLWTNGVFNPNPSFIRLNTFSTQSLYLIVVSVCKGVNESFVIATKNPALSILFLY